MSRGLRASQIKERKMLDKVGDACDDDAAAHDDDGIEAEEKNM
jgi:hypothetical protein